MLATFDNTILVLLAPTYRTQLYVQCIKAKNKIGALTRMQQCSAELKLPGTRVTETQPITTFFVAVSKTAKRCSIIITEKWDRHNQLVCCVCQNCQNQERRGSCRQKGQ